MREIHMDIVHDVLGALEKVARDHLDGRTDGPSGPSAFFQARQWSEERRIAFAQIGKDETVRFVRGIGGKFPHAVAEGFGLGRLLDAAAGLVVAPAVIAAARAATSE